MTTDVVIVGDGPGGLSAALFLAKMGKQVAVYGQDNTAMHAALLKNYLGIVEMTGTEFQEIARAQVKQFGAQVVDYVLFCRVTLPSARLPRALDGGTCARIARTPHCVGLLAHP